MNSDSPREVHSFKLCVQVETIQDFSLPLDHIFLVLELPKATLPQDPNPPTPPQFRTKDLYIKPQQQQISVSQSASPFTYELTPAELRESFVANDLVIELWFHDDKAEDNQDILVGLSTVNLLSLLNTDPVRIQPNVVHSMHRQCSIGSYTEDKKEIKQICTANLFIMVEDLGTILPTTASNSVIIPLDINEWEDLEVFKRNEEDKHVLMLKQKAAAISASLEKEIKAKIEEEKQILLEQIQKAKNDLDSVKEYRSKVLVPEHHDLLTSVEANQQTLDLIKLEREEKKAQFERIQKMLKTETDEEIKLLDGKIAHLQTTFDRNRQILAADSSRMTQINKLRSDISVSKNKVNMLKQEYSAIQSEIQVLEFKRAVDSSRN
ncbi:hypothetical protein BLNAU_8899 [Blattamonas nauphoetae]|uniref:Uncharacterized protein n=1 Tax=Blattamonas nauphoetae TaxID=2049346 RepID=A0ABQ9XXC7_9EUKA|nr:hypothetical protein BLNAU_8899 [Blattamonas nauphoetae]